MRVPRCRVGQLRRTVVVGRGRVRAFRRNRHAGHNGNCRGTGTGEFHRRRFYRDGVVVGRDHTAHLAAGYPGRVVANDRCLRPGSRRRVAIDTDARFLRAGRRRRVVIYGNPGRSFTGREFMVVHVPRRVVPAGGVVGGRGAARVGIVVPVRTNRMRAAGRTKRVVVCVIRVVAHREVAPGGRVLNPSCLDIAGRTAPLLDCLDFRIQVAAGSHVGAVLIHRITEYVVYVDVRVLCRGGSQVDLVRRLVGPVGVAVDIVGVLERGVTDRPGIPFHPVPDRDRLRVGRYPGRWNRRYPLHSTLVAAVEVEFLAHRRRGDFLLREDAHRHPGLAAALTVIAVVAVSVVVRALFAVRHAKRLRVVQRSHRVNLRPLANPGLPLIPKHAVRHP